MFHQRRFWTYVLTNWEHTTLYTGMTNNLYFRLMEHYAGVADGFSSKYKTFYLVWYEETKYVLNAIALEKEIKLMSRARKEELIESMNPLWHHYNEEIVGNWPPTHEQLAAMMEHRGHEERRIAAVKRGKTKE